MMLSDTGTIWRSREPPARRKGGQSRWAGRSRLIFFSLQLLHANLENLKFTETSKNTIFMGRLVIDWQLRAKAPWEPLPFPSSATHTATPCLERKCHFYSGAPYLNTKGVCVARPRPRSHLRPLKRALIEINTSSVIWDYEQSKCFVHVSVSLLWYMFWIIKKKDVRLHN